MTRRPAHTPAPPRSPDPPGRLIEIASALSHPEVSRAGLTTTADGEWALLIRVRPDTRTPIPYIEDASAGFPVIYQDEPERPVIARPAFPAKGE